jgi:ankyrin repeat protein
MLCHGVKFGYTALMEASGRGHAAVVQALIGAGADINLQNKASSALHELCYH